MSPDLRPVLRPLSIIVLPAILLLAGACHKNTESAAAAPAPAANSTPAVPVVVGPEPFTAQLPVVDGVQALICLRHPKLINQDIEKLMTAVPEAAMLRGFLSKLSDYGYPDFADLGEGSNIGLVVLSLTADDLKNNNSVELGFAKLKDGGKLAPLVAAFATQKHGDWVIFGKDAAALAQLKNPDAVIAYFDKPQTEDIRLWGRLSPELLKSIEAKGSESSQAGMAHLTPEQQKAARGYLDALFALAAQVHSVGFSLAFTDDAIKIAYSAQFLPDSPLGTAFRYKPSAAPAVARYVSADALVTGFVRENPKMVSDLMNTLFDAALAVDYPPVTDPIKLVRAGATDYMNAVDGSGAGNMSVALGNQNGQARLTPEFFWVLSGHLTPEIVKNYYTNAQTAIARLMNFVSSNVKPATAFAPALPIMHATFAQNVLTVDGVAFDSTTMTSTVNGKDMPSSTYYTGLVDGNLVLGSNEQILKDSLPALQTKSPVANPIATPEIPDEIMELDLNGAKFVDLVAAVGKLDPADAAIQAQLTSMKAGFTAGTPASMTMDIGQAQGSVTTAIPYKFIESSVRIGAFIAMRKINFTSLMPAPGVPAAPAPPTTPAGP